MSTRSSRSSRLSALSYHFFAFVVVALLAFGGWAPASAGSVDPTVTVAIHIVLEVPHALDPRPDSYCTGDRRPYALRPISDTLLRSYETQLRAIGTVSDHFGFGTWTIGATNVSDVAFEGGDHVFLTARLSRVKRFLPGFLRAMRRDLHQQETLAEIFGSQDTALGEPRTRLEVVVPYAHTSYRTLRRLHVIFGDAGRSGATQYDDERGVHVYSSVKPVAVVRMQRALSAAGFRYASSPSTFVTDDAPPCAS